MRQRRKPTVDWASCRSKVQSYFGTDDCRSVIGRYTVNFREHAEIYRWMPIVRGNVICSRFHRSFDRSGHPTCLIIWIRFTEFLGSFGDDCWNINDNWIDIWKYIQSGATFSRHWSIPYTIQVSYVNQFYKLTSCFLFFITFRHLFNY